MDLSEMLKDGSWDAPFFKKLPRNDTGQGPGHQGGFVVPKELRKYFPTLDEARTSNEKPTIDRRFQVDLYDGTRYIGSASTRYQLQTWGGTRSAESRVTDELSPLRQLAMADDILIMQRRMDNLEHYRFILVRQASVWYDWVIKLTGGSRWGVLDSTSPPAAQEDIYAYSEEIEELSSGDFRLFVEELNRVESRQQRIMRCTLFPLKVFHEYQGRCCVSGTAIQTPGRLFEIQAAHIVPVSEGGTNDIRNGITLSRTLHWAFDQGLFGITKERTIFVPDTVRQIQGNTYLTQFHGQQIAEAKSPSRRAHPEALKWHYENRVAKWL